MVHLLVPPSLVISLLLAISLDLLAPTGSADSPGPASECAACVQHHLLSLAIVCRHAAVSGGNVGLEQKRQRIVAVLSRLLLFVVDRDDGDCANLDLSNLV